MKKIICLIIFLASISCYSQGSTIKQITDPIMNSDAMKGKAIKIYLNNKEVDDPANEYVDYSNLKLRVQKVKPADSITEEQIEIRITTKEGDL